MTDELLSAVPAVAAVLCLPVRSEMSWSLNECQLIAINQWASADCITVASLNAAQQHAHDRLQQADPLVSKCC
jgi:hypothetical protein